LIDNKYTVAPSGRRVTVGLGKYKLDYASTIVERPISTILHAIVYTVVGNTVRPSLIIGELVYRIVIHSIGGFEIRYLDTRGNSLS